jgi:hypothetical protein
MLDNDISGHADLLSGTLESTGWAEYEIVKFVTLPDMGIALETDDRDIWRFCQANSLILLTGNRNKEDDTSLEQTLLNENTDDCLPVLTVSVPKRLTESAYREDCIYSVIDIILNLSNNLGTARLYIPQ